MTQSEVRELKKVIEHCELKHACFGHIFREEPVPAMIEGDVTEFIRKRTRLYRNSWILPTLRKLVAKYDRPSKKQTREFLKFQRQAGEALARTVVERQQS